MEIIQVQKAEAMKEVAEKILSKANQYNKDKAVVIALTGQLGAGKTTLVQELARELGVAEPVTSPTYVVMKGYELESRSFSQLVHIDAYRIEDIDEMRVLKFAELLKENNTIICIEWPEHIAALVPEDAINVSIKIDGEARTVSIT